MGFSGVIPSQSNLYPDTTQHIPDHQPQADLRATALDEVISPPAQPVDHQDLLEESRLKRQVWQFAQKYGIDVAEGSDPTAVLQEVEREVERRAKSSGKRSSRRIFSFASFREALASVFNKINAEELKRPRRRGFAVSITRHSITRKSPKIDAEELKTPGYLGSAASITHQSISHESPSLAQGVRSRLGLYRFWAILIGIDAYAGVPLRGCVSDALLIKRFLTNDLGVPEKRIQCLLGPGYPNSVDTKSTPSRTNIIDTLYSLVNNPEIERGDNIIIYYAGHGSSYCCAKHDLKSRCDSSCAIEALCPIDRDCQDSDGNWIPDISDRELNSLFMLICCAKGQNITFIADCCHSGGMSRGLHVTAVGRQSRIRRTASTYNASLEDMLHAADERWKDFPGYRSVLSKDWEPDMDSHVILAACQSDQAAMEVKGREGFGGAFTKELVRVLGSTDCKEETTYDDIIRLLNQLPYQTPLVAGTRMFKPVFNRASHQFWAVLIGIDAYPRYPLHGCVSDALSIKRFLINDLGMPENHIQCLLGPEYPNDADPKSTPSRSNIVYTLYSLVNSLKIERGDNIIIYYAGHGSSYCCAKHDLKSRCDSFCLIEALCPIDRGTQDEDGEWIPDISDRELDSLFTQICLAKGHKITFIIDCSFSHSFSHQDLVDPGIRSIHLTSHASPDDMLRAADERWKDLPHYQSILSKD